MRLRLRKGRLPLLPLTVKPMQRLQRHYSIACPTRLVTVVSVERRIRLA